MSHGDQQSKIPLIQAIRGLEERFGRPTTILADLQGPKLRVGKFAQGKGHAGDRSTFILDRDPTPGDATRVELPHKEIFAAIEPGARLLLDDGKLVLRVAFHDADKITTLVEVGGALSNNKGLNVPDVVLPMAALTEKDRSDLAFAVEQGVDWIALSFVQRPEDLMEARGLIKGRAALLAKIEKPQAIDRLEENRRAVRRRDGRARRPGRRTAAPGRPASPEAHRRGVAPHGPPGGRRDADARVDDPEPLAHPRRGVGRGDRHL